MKKGKRKAGGLRHIAGNNLYMLGFIWRTAPEIFFVDFLEKILSSTLAFVFDVWLLRHIINGFQAGENMKDMLVLILALTVGRLAYNFLFIAFYQIRYPVLQLRVNEKLQKMLFRKSGEVELACYEDKAFFDKFVKASGDLNNRVWAVFDSVGSILFFLLSMSLNTLFLLTIDPFLIVFAIFPAIVAFFLGKKRNGIQHEYDMKKREEEQQRNYARRTFYLSDFAKEMRLTNICRVMLRRFDRSIKNIIAYIKKYGFKLAAIGYIMEESNEVVSERCSTRSTVRLFPVQWATATVLRL